MAQKGHYATFHKKSGEEIGGCIYWNIDKQEKSYWTSCWWLFEDIRDLYIDLYVVEKGVFTLTKQRQHINLIFSHNLRVGEEMLGTLEMRIV